MSLDNLKKRMESQGFDKKKPSKVLDRDSFIKEMKSLLGDNFTVVTSNGKEGNSNKK